MMLADLGADVIRVDRTSGVGNPSLEGRPGELLSRGRRSIALDLKRPEGLAILRRLACWADVLVDPYRPGVIERIGLAPEAALEDNPKLVFARMTGWGQAGPLARSAGHDLNYIAVAGALDLLRAADDGLPPVPLNLIGDFGGGGMLLGFGIVTALLERERSGRGQILDVAMVDGVATLLTSILQLRQMGQWRSEPGSNWLQGAAPWYSPYRTSDGGVVTFGALEPKFYALLLQQLGLDVAAWPQWDEARWPALCAVMAATIGAEPRRVWQERFEGTDVCFGVATTLDELLEHPQLAARETYVRHDGVVQPAPAPRFSRTPGRLSRPVPWAGEHTNEILAELGASEAEIDGWIGGGTVLVV
jgi:alpha-methylacyl-CoA racemase